MPSRAEHEAGMRSFVAWKTHLNQLLAALNEAQEVCNDIIDAGGESAEEVWHKLDKIKAGLL